jgi:transcriptional regulator with XRE-family HTH domain
MTPSSAEFGTELRRHRLEKDISLAQLARAVHYSKGYLSRIENGTRSPNRDLARRCDVALGIGGALAALLPAASMEAPLSPLGPVSLTDERLALEPQSAQLSRDPVALEAFEALFGEFRRLGGLVSSRLIDKTIVEQTKTLVAAAQAADGKHRPRLQALSARYAEYAGWMLQESGADQEALWWTSIAVELADAIGDDTMAVQGLIRQALFALYRGDAQSVVDLAGAASRSASAPAWLRAQALQRQAQGHALAGDYDATRRALDQAAALPPDPDLPAKDLRLGPTTIDMAAVNQGWCLCDLGETQTAAEILDRELPKIPVVARRSRARFGTRRALAYALGGEPRQACAAALDVLPDAAAIQSATINVDIVRLGRALARWRTDPDVRSLLPRISVVLRMNALRGPTATPWAARGSDFGR